MENQRIDFYLKVLAELSTDLVKLKHLNAELEQKVKISDAVEQYLDGFNFSSASPMQRNVDLQQNNDRAIFETFFTNKEVKKLPTLKDFSYRFKSDKLVHEFRYRRNGIDKSFSSKNLSEAKRKAMDFAKILNQNEASLFGKGGKKSNFIALANEFLFNTKKPNVSQRTFETELNRFKNHIAPFFNVEIKSINASMIQSHLNKYLQNDQKRTAEGIYYLFKSIFDYAVNIDVIVKSPMLAVKIPLHERQNGIALSLEDERTFLAKIKNSRYELQYVLMLYAGCRPCELETLSFQKAGFLTFRNLKQKKNKVVFKEIPITPMLAPFIERIKRAKIKNEFRAGKAFRNYIAGYRLYDLRHTFATRCQTCGVPQEVVSAWMGHKNGSITNTVYTHFPDKYMLEMAKKVDY